MTNTETLFLKESSERLRKKANTLFTLSINLQEQLVSANREIRELKKANRALLNANNQQNNIIPMKRERQTGYPAKVDEDLIATIQNWKSDNYYDLIGFLRRAWHDDGKVMSIFDVGIFKLITGGHPVNESIIKALKANLPFWNKYWLTSKKGGIHIFDLAFE